MTRSSFIHHVVILLTFSVATSWAQETSTLFQTISKMDSAYFGAQNDCNLELYQSYLTEDLEFYHDKAGLTSSLENEMADMAIFCGEQRNRQPLRREMVKGTLEVYPLNNFGAIEHCEHVFYLQINDGSEKLVAKAKFTGIWKLEKDTWKISRILSYDHQPLADTVLANEVLKRYVGNYILPDRVVNIIVEGKLLRVTDIINGEPGWTKELFPEAENRFYLNYENVVYEFLGKGSMVSTLNIYENGAKIEVAKKED